MEQLDIWVTRSNEGISLAEYVRRNANLISALIETKRKWAWITDYINRETNSSVKEDTVRITFNRIKSKYVSKKARNAYIKTINKIDSRNAIQEAEACTTKPSNSNQPIATKTHETTSCNTINKNGEKTPPTSKKSSSSTSNKTETKPRNCAAGNISILADFTARNQADDF